MATPKTDAVYKMPQPSAVVVWRHAPGGDPVSAIVTAAGRSAISVMLFPPDSRSGTPREAVRYVGDPQVKTQLNADAGVWDFTDETKELRRLADLLASLTT